MAIDVELVEQRCQRAADAIGERAIRRAGASADLARDVLHRVLHGRDEALLTVAEHPVERALAHACPLAQQLDGHVLPAALGRELGDGGHQRRALARAPGDGEAAARRPRHLGRRSRGLAFGRHRHFPDRSNTMLSINVKRSVCAPRSGQRASGASRPAAPPQRRPRGLGAAGDAAAVRSATRGGARAPAGPARRWRPGARATPRAPGAPARPGPSAGAPCPARASSAAGPPPSPRIAASTARSPRVTVLRQLVAISVAGSDPADLVTCGWPGSSSAAARATRSRPHRRAPAARVADAPPPAARARIAPACARATGSACPAPARATWC